MYRRSVFYQAAVVLAVVMIPALILLYREEPQQAKLSEISGDWQVSELLGKNVIAGTNISIEFLESGRFGGFGGCNDYGGYFEIGLNGVVDFSEIESTAAGCMTPTGVLAQEVLFFDTLQRIDSLESQSNGLKLLDENGAVLISLSPIERFKGLETLDGSNWLLDSIGGQSVISDPAVSIHFGQDVFGGFAGCRYFTGTYLLDADAIYLTSIRMLSASCSSPEQQVIETQFLDTLDYFKQYVVREDGLELRLKTGEVMQFRPVAISRRTDIGLAEEALITFFERLVSMDYAQAAERYLPSETFYEELRAKNPEVEQGNTMELLRRACLMQYRCMPVHEVVFGQQLTSAAVYFQVIFENPDGLPFVSHACCSALGAVNDEPTIFEYVVEEQVDGFFIIGELVYSP